MGDILVVYAFLDTLEHQARTTAAALADASRLTHVEFTGNPAVTEAYADFLGRWDTHRGSLVEGVTAVADALRVVRDAFVRTDDELAAALGPDG